MQCTLVHNSIKLQSSVDLAGAKVEQIKEDCSAEGGVSNVTAFSW